MGNSLYIIYIIYVNYIYENMQEKEDKVAYKINNLDKFYFAFSVIHTIPTFKVCMRQFLE